MDARLARLELSTAVGLSGPDADWPTPKALPLPVATEDDPAELRRMAAAYNLDLLAARKAAGITERADVSTRRQRLLGATAVGDN